MNKRKSTNDFSTILSSFLILLLVVGVVGFLFIRTENFTTPLKDFYVRVGNDDIIADRDNFDVYTGKDYKFEIKTSISVSGSNTKYYVSVLPNETPTTTFSFNVGEETKNYADMESLAKGFSISTYEDYFIFRANMDMQSILALYYPTQTLTNVPTALDTGLPYFTLAITSANKTETININFNLIKQIAEDEDILTINLGFTTSNVVTSTIAGVVDFSNPTIELTNNFNVATFTFEITNYYQITSISQSQFFDVEINDNVCTVLLNTKIYRTFTQDLIFEIVCIGNDDATITFSICEYSGNKEQGHITFSTDKVVLTNTDRIQTFTYSLDDGYYCYITCTKTTEKIDILYYAGSAGPCTVSLVEENFILTESSSYYIYFHVYSN